MARKTRKPVKRAEKPDAPIVGLVAFLKAADEGAFSRPQNPLCAHRKPLEILKACEELARGQFNATFQRHEHVGQDHIWAMLFGALQSVHADFTLLDKHARKVAGES